MNDCKKISFDRIKAMLVVANSQKRTQKNFKRKEIRVYFCPICKSYHVTSQKIKKVVTILNNYRIICNVNINKK